MFVEIPEYSRFSRFLVTLSNCSTCLRRWDKCLSITWISQAASKKNQFSYKDQI